jgi:hypothetical protein
VGTASIVLNVLSVVTLPMVLAVGVMTTDSPHTSKRHFRALKGFLAGHLVVVLASIAAAWWLRSQSRPGAALLSALSPAAWIALAFGLVALLGFGGTRGQGKG